MRKFKFEQVNSTPYKGLDGTVIFHDGTDPTHHILIESVNGLGVPQSIVQTQQAPFQVGASPIRTTYGPRTISLECAIIVDSKNNRSQIESIKRDLGNLFSPVGMGYVPNNSTTTSPYSTVTGKLSYAQDGVTYDRFIDCVPISVEFPNRPYSDGFQRFRVALFCPNPTWYGQSNTVTFETPMTLPTGSFATPCYSDDLGYTLVCDKSTGTIYRAYDGVSYEAIGSISGVGGNMIWDKYRSLFVMFDPATSGALTSIWTSPTGVTWSQTTGDPGSPGTFAGMAFPGRLLAFTNRTTYSSTFYTSTDGVTFTTGTLPSSIRVTSACYGEGLGIGVIVGYDSGAVNRTYYSYDGVTWFTGTLSATGSEPTDLIFCDTDGRFVCFFGSTMEVSTSGTTFGTAVALGDTYGRPAWSNARNILMAVTSSPTGVKAIRTSDLATITTTTKDFTVSGDTIYMDNLDMFVALPSSGGTYPNVSYDATNIIKVSSATFASVISSPLTILSGTSIVAAGPVSISSGIAVTVQSTGIWTITNAGVDFVTDVTNSGDIPIDFTLRIPVIGNETGKSLVISDNFVWDGVGNPPTDKNLIISTTGLKPGFIEVATAFGAKDITQFGRSVMSNFTSGTFFNLFVSGNVTNRIYVRNTGVTAGPPVITWKNRYLGV